MWWQEPHYPDSNRNCIPWRVVWVIDPETGEVLIMLTLQSTKTLQMRTMLERLDIDLCCYRKDSVVLLLGLFLPHFTGTKWDETERTLNYLLSKPIHRGSSSFIASGYLAVVSVFVLILSLVMALITSVIGPGIALSDLVTSLFEELHLPQFSPRAYGSLFAAIGLLLPK